MPALEKLNVSKWIEKNKVDFKPPVCNKCMYENQLKAFLVGGPNIRKDFHLEEGEEVFYMVQGDMVLRAVEKARVKDIVIKEGYIYMQPVRVLHSPQRYADTVGLVVERSRAEFELDSLRYFVDEVSLDPLFERWFYMTDAVADLPPIIHDYFNSEAHKTGKPTADSLAASRPYEADPDVYFDEPVHLKTWVEENQAYINEHGSKVLFGAPRFKSEITVWGPGKHTLDKKPGERFLWHFEGSGKVQFAGEVFELKAVETVLIPVNSECILDNGEHSYSFTVYMPTPSHP